MRPSALRDDLRTEPVLVVAGFDPIRHALYLQVWEDPETRSRRDQVVLYASHLDVHRDWSDIESVADALDALSIDVPAAFLETLEDDRLARRRGRVRLHRCMAPAHVA